MKNLLFGSCLFLELICFAATPAFTDFNTNQFNIANNKVKIKSGVNLTNVTFPDGSIQNTAAVNGQTNTSSNVGSGVGIANAKNGVDLPFKSFVAAGFGSVATNATNLTITFNQSGETNTMSNVGSGVGIAGIKSGVNFPFKSLTAAGFGTVASNATDITVTFLQSGETNTYSSLASSNATVKPVISAKSGVNFPFYALEQGSNIVLFTTPTSIVVNASSSGDGGGETNWTRFPTFIAPTAFTNWLQLFTNGNVAIANTNTGAIDLNFTLDNSLADLSATVFEHHELFRSVDDPYWYLNAKATGTNGVTSEIRWYLEPNVAGGDYLDWYVNGAIALELYPSAPDGTAIASFDSSVLHTSGLLFVLNNKTTNTAGITHKGAFASGKGFDYFGSPAMEENSGFHSISFEELDGTGFSDLYMVVSDYKTNFDNLLDSAVVDIFSSHGGNNSNEAGELYTAYNAAGHFGEWRLRTRPHDMYLRFRQTGGNELLLIEPTASDGNQIVQFSAEVPHTSGDLFKVWNSITNDVSPKFAVDYSGAISAGSSNIADIGSAELPYRTNYAGAFTVIGSLGGMYSDGGLVYADVDRFKLSGATPVNTNLVIPLVATLNITNGLIMSVTGP